KLEFNSHVHTIVTAGGLHESSGRWVSSVYYDHAAMMRAWRRAVINLLRAALRAGRLRTNMTNDQVEELLTSKETRPWIIKVQSLKSKAHFLRYAGRYVRRPPIAQRRITYIGERTVTFWYKDIERPSFKPYPQSFSRCIQSTRSSDEQISPWLL